MKTCVVCKQMKNLDEYHNLTKSKDGKSYRCKSCDKAARARSRAKSPNTKLGYRRRKLQLKYGITLEDYEQMLKEQNYRCAICKTDNPAGRGVIRETKVSFAVDHCHTTMRVRGLLCNLCNRALGFFRDDPEIIRRAGEYLNQAGCH